MDARFLFKRENLKKRIMAAVLALLQRIEAN